MERRADDIHSRVATLEANQVNLANTLAGVVSDMKGIVLELAQRRGAEKLALVAFGGLMTFIGWVSHIVFK